MLVQYALKAVLASNPLRRYGKKDETLKPADRCSVDLCEMKATSMVPAALAAVIVYFCLELFFGVYGLVSYEVLKEARDVAREDLAEARRQQRLLEQTVRSLTTDPETIMLEARDIGLVSSSEIVLRIRGYDPRPVHRYVTGSIPRSVDQVRDNRQLFRALALAVFLATILVQIALAGPPQENRWRRGLRLYRDREDSESSSDPDDGETANRRHSR